MDEHEYRDETVGNAIRGLPTPLASTEFHAELERRVTADGIPGHSRRSVKLRLSGRRPNRRSALFASVIATALALGGIAGGVLAGPSSGATTPVVPAFQPTLGWNTFEANVGDAPLPVAYASSVAFQALDTSGSLPPTATLQNLPSNGIVIAIGGPWRYTGSDALPQLQFPLQLSHMDFHAAPYEGSVAPNVSEYITSGLVSGSSASQQTLEVFVWMGTNNPTQDMINAVNRELEQLQMPS